MDAPGRQMEKSGRIERRSGLRWASKKRGSEKVVGKGTVCTGRAEQRKSKKNKSKNKIE
jgi:hypothetical protein